MPEQELAGSQPDEFQFQYLARIVKDKGSRPEWHNVRDSENAARLVESLRQQGWHSISFYKNGMLWCKAVLGPDSEPFVLSLLQGGEIEELGNQS